MIRGKRGWIRIVEAFIAVLLIAGVLLIVINKGYFGKEDISQKIYNEQLSILRGIETNEELRTAILEVSVPMLPMQWTSDSFPISVRKYITLKTPTYLTCAAVICALEVLCPLNPYPVETSGKDVYAQPVAIAANSDIYQPRQLKLFCWVK